MMYTIVFVSFRVNNSLDNFCSLDFLQDLPIMWAFRPLTQRTGPVVELPVSFPSLAPRKGFLYDLIDAASMKTRATSIHSLRRQGEDALMEIGLQERLILHQLNEVDKADHWLVCLNTARETWDRVRRTIFPKFYEISVHFLPPIFQCSTSLEQTFFYGNYNAFATWYNYSEECQNARAVFNPAGCFSTITFNWQLLPASN